jgi:Tat protein translocase TatB subunit
MEFLGVGPLELLLILLIALIVLGPDKLPEIARQIGKAMREFNRLSKGMTEEFYRELEAAEEKKTTASKPVGDESGEDVPEGRQEDKGATDAGPEDAASVAGEQSEAEKEHEQK